MGDLAAGGAFIPAVDLGSFGVAAPDHPVKLLLVGDTQFVLATVAAAGVSMPGFIIHGSGGLEFGERLIAVRDEVQHAVDWVGAGHGPAIGGHIPTGQEFTAGSFGFGGGGIAEGIGRPTAGAADFSFE